MKWYVYLICFALMIAGVFCGVRLYELTSAESYVNGSIDIKNKFTVESFVYSNDNVTFYPTNLDTGEFVFETNLKPVNDFNGVRNAYQVVLNNYILTDTTIMAGALFAKVYLDFYDTNGEIVCSSFMDISVKFLSDKTTLTFATTTGENASFLTQYFHDYGINLKINQIKGNN